MRLRSGCGSLASPLFSARMPSRVASMRRPLFAGFVVAGTCPTMSSVAFWAAGVGTALAGAHARGLRSCGAPRCRRLACLLPLLLRLYAASHAPTHHLHRSGPPGSDDICDFETILYGRARVALSTWRVDVCLFASSAIKSRSGIGADMCVPGMAGWAA